MTLKTFQIRSARFFQATLLLIYRVAVSSGLLSTRWGRRAFERAYMVYKNRFEAATADGLRWIIEPDASVIDVGANIGFFTLRFARWVSGSAKVYALEPEPANFDRLNQAIVRAQLEDRVEAQRLAVSETSGQVLLTVDPVHPGNHRLGETGLRVPSTSIDSFMAQHDWPHVGLIKIDVQGAEHRVLAGATETLRRFRPALYVEIDRDSTGGDLLQHLMERGYQPHLVHKSSPPVPTTPEHARQLVQARGYHDFLFLADQAEGLAELPSD